MHGEVNHQLSCLVVIYCFGCPDASYICQRGVEACKVNVGACPADQVATLHEYQPSVVAPAKLLAVALPFGSSEAVALAKHVQVGHGEIECAVWTLEDVWVANAMLLGYGVARDDGLVVVQRFPVVSITA